MTTVSVSPDYYVVKEKLESKDVTLVAVSKTQTAESILELYNQGHRNFGENRVQELSSKASSLPSDIIWHMIGHLQRNKVKYIAPFVSMIQSVDSRKLLKEINKQAALNQRSIPCLLQFHIASETSKFGLNIDEANAILSDGIEEFKNIQFSGVMGMASFTEDKSLIRSEFESLVQHYNILRKSFFAENDQFNIISMGMSGDYQLAIECGSNMVRLGSLIFGERKT